MNKFHVVRKIGANIEMTFAGVSVSRQHALEYANGMNQYAVLRNIEYGTYFVVPAPFAGEI